MGRGIGVASSNVNFQRSFQATENGCAPFLVDMIHWLDIKWNKVMVGKFFKVQR